MGTIRRLSLDDGRDVYDLLQAMPIPGSSLEPRRPGGPNPPLQNAQHA